MKNNFLPLFLSLIILFISVSLITSQESSYRDESERRERTPEEIAREEFSSQWEKEMSDYEPDFVYMIPLDYKSSDVFYQKIENVSQNFRLRGAILIDEDKKESIDFRIESPSGLIVYQNTTSQCIFNIEIKEKGVYKFYFDNKYENSEIRVTFTINSGNNNVVKRTDLDFSNKTANDLLEFLEKMKTERKLKKNSEYNRTLSKNFLYLFFRKIYFGNICFLL